MLSEDGEHLGSPSRSESWLDTVEMRYRTLYPSFALSRRCFFCGREGDHPTSDTVIASVVVITPPCEDVFLPTTDGWVCHGDCVSAARHPDAPDGPRGRWDDEGQKVMLERSTSCFFCAQDAATYADRPWVMFATKRGEAESETTMAWLCHFDCLRAARNPAVPEWRQLDGEILEWDELIEEHRGATEPHWREQVARALWWKAHKLREMGSREDALPVWHELARQFSKGAEAEIQQLVRSGLAEEAVALVEMRRGRDAQQVFFRLAAGWWAPGRSPRIHTAIGWTLVAAVWLVMALRLRGPLVRLAMRSNAKLEASRPAE